MSKLVLVTGGARSGKSSFAEKFVKDISNNPLYVATAIAFDDEMKARINKHKINRGDEFKTLERYKDFRKVNLQTFKYIDSILLDCITVMLTNIMMEFFKEDDFVQKIDEDAFEQRAIKEIEDMLDIFKSNVNNIVIVTNEIGMGIVPENYIARVFRDIAGRINQLVAKQADEVYYCVCGISNKIK